MGCSLKLNHPSIALCSGCLSDKQKNLITVCLSISCLDLVSLASYLNEPQQRLIEVITNKRYLSAKSEYKLKELLLSLLNQ